MFETVEDMGNQAMTECCSTRNSNGYSNYNRYGNEFFSFQQGESKSLLAKRCPRPAHPPRKLEMLYVITSGWNMPSPGSFQQEGLTDTRNGPQNDQDAFPSCDRLSSRLHHKPPRAPPHIALRR